MRDWVIARRYARAVYKLSYARETVEDVLADLGAFAALFREREALRRFLAHPAIPFDDKLSVIKKIVANDTVRDFLEFLIGRDRLTLLPAIFAEFREVYRKDEGIVAARMTSAMPMPEDIKKRLAAAVESMTGKRVQLEAVVDEDVIGGMSLRIGDRVIDATLATRLKEIREAMAGAG
jgi:F-type H+-transporting ATPase subunit delta